jgi:hypothetical protein
MRSRRAISARQRRRLSRAILEVPRGWSAGGTEAMLACDLGHEGAPARGGGILEMTSLCWVAINTCRPPTPRTRRKELVLSKFGVKPVRAVGRPAAECVGRGQSPNPSGPLLSQSLRLFSWSVGGELDPSRQPLSLGELEDDPPSGGWGGGLQGDERVANARPSVVLEDEIAKPAVRRGLLAQHWHLDANGQQRLWRHRRSSTPP